ncbi:uncharacterized protein K452DRAFT_235246 [Aplosporella prunicola CBS 121167]|uniref:F-box domain-containing protein n=1 Tax=Aplosporella prunicola CBS 121167 TaxID=1176127 RepID=A0A6A6B5D0_9PEZI|nr:uncharacterized protein K452DRAFT_235246 [Aplosporella prunicola CBS 121167]KAF2137951.1 hypothetical protein K452DRAFT_235246 [Aplosporella prunicola CBS 121167]
MNDVLPSYEAANTRDPWTIIARYIPSTDLCSAALVCRQWHDIFTPQLWGNPASHFGVQNDVVYVALTRFKRTLAWARLSTRWLTHTLHFPPAHAEIYDGPHSDWLRDILERLPRLQSLIVSELPFFDHGALTTLRRPSNFPSTSHSDRLPRQLPDSPVFGLRYLEASCCKNATYSGLAEALKHFPSLLYLDLSKTKSAKDAHVLSVLNHCFSLRILKLRSIGLTDKEVEALARAVKRGLKSLDLRDNQLTDNSARILLENCFKVKNVPRLGPSDTPPEEPESTYSSLISRADSERQTGRIFDEHNKEDLDARVRSELVGEFSGTAILNDTYDGGITHLYISDNHLSVEGISGLLRSGRLQVLDAGTVMRGITRSKARSLLFPEDSDPTAGFTMPGAEKLTPIIKAYASEKLTYLRINHAVVTEETAIADLAAGRQELQGNLAVYAPSNARELDAVTNQIHEVSGDSAFQEMSGEEWRAELPGDSQIIAELPGDMPYMPEKYPSNQPGVVVERPEIPKVKKGSAFAPEVVPDLGNLRLADGEGTLDTLDGSDTHSSVRSLQKGPLFVAANDRRSRLQLRQSTENTLHPRDVARIETLVLTDVPKESTMRESARRLIQFISDCAEEVAIAKMRARIAYTLPPGRDRQAAEREYARSQFQLRRIVLEMAMDEEAYAPKKPTTTWRQYPTKSSTEDADSEAFWSAAAHDFSFFGDEECGIPGMEPGRTLPLALLSEKIILPSVADPPPVLLAPNQQRKERAVPCFDVVKEVAAFRKECRAKYAARVAVGEAEPDVEGLWEGEVSVVRPSPKTEMRGDVDCYGNYYEQGYNYR